MDAEWQSLNGDKETVEQFLAEQRAVSHSAVNSPEFDGFGVESPGAERHQSTASDLAATTNNKGDKPARQFQHPTSSNIERITSHPLAADAEVQSVGFEASIQHKTAQQIDLPSGVTSLRLVGLGRDRHDSAVALVEIPDLGVQMIKVSDVVTLTADNRHRKMRVETITNQDLRVQDEHGQYRIPFKK
ncbi:MAG: hypothetical protein MI861_17285 [Pirellulales bacterium]|nr:hypothetical protein [Pirellulales bacterium]